MAKTKLAVRGRRIIERPELDAETELRRWCIEEAIRWPEESNWKAYAGTSGYPSKPETDVIGRAKRIFDWVTSRG
jgi:hypothetical protein